jgi:hypothetical protein
MPHRIHTNSDEFALLVLNNPQAKIEVRSGLHWPNVFVDGQRIVSMAITQVGGRTLISWITDDVCRVYAGFSGEGIQHWEELNGVGTWPWLHEWHDDTLWICYTEQDECESFAMRIRPEGPVFTMERVKLGTTVDITADRRIGASEWNDPCVRIFSLIEFKVVAVVDRAMAKEQGLHPHDTEPDDVPARSF